MATRTTDSTGLVAALALGVVVGALLASPVLPRDLSIAVGGSALGPVGSALLVGVVVVFAVPLGVFALYGYFAALE